MRLRFFHPQISDSTSSQVNSRGLSCETAHDWRTAEQRLHSNQYDVIVVDPTTETHDEHTLIEHIVNEPSAHNAKIVVLGQEPEIASTDNALLIRSESDMLADIDSLLERIGLADE